MLMQGGRLPAPAPAVWQQYKPAVGPQLTSPAWHSASIPPRPPDPSQQVQPASADLSCQPSHAHQARVCPHPDGSWTGQEHTASFQHRSFMDRHQVSARQNRQLKLHTCKSVDSAGWPSIKRAALGCSETTVSVVTSTLAASCVKQTSALLKAAWAYRRSSGRGC